MRVLLKRLNSLQEKNQNQNYLKNKIKKLQKTEVILLYANHPVKNDECTVAMST